VRLWTVTAPTGYPVSVELARAQLRVDLPDDDALIDVQIGAATALVEAYTKRQLMPATYALVGDAFPRAGVFDVPRPPLVSVTSLTYTTGAGVLETLDPAAYQVDAPTGAHAGRGRVVPAPRTSWPIAQAGRIDAVALRFVAGYAPDTDAITLEERQRRVPEAIKVAILLYVGDFFDYRKNHGVSALTELPSGAKAVLGSFRVFVMDFEAYEIGGRRVS
jgi:uncharacterized phiE125 gp8 family phage protein